MSAWKDSDGKIFSRAIIVQIRKDLLPDYNKLLLLSIKAYFTEKKAVPMLRTTTDSDGNQFEKDFYQLTYYRPNSKVDVDVDEENIWTEYAFRIRFF